MKNLVFLALILISIKSFGQYKIPQIIGSDSTLVTSKGGLKGRVINWPYTDTAAANLQPIKLYPGAQIFTLSDNKFWLRNSDATAWINVGSGGVGVLSFAKNFTRDSAILTLTDLTRFAVKDSIGTSFDPTNPTDPMNDTAIGTPEFVLGPDFTDSGKIKRWYFRQPIYVDTAYATTDTTLHFKRGIIEWDVLFKKDIAYDSLAWHITGNSINAGTNFLGTTNNISLRLRTNNTEKMVLDSNGNVGIGTGTPTAKLHILTTLPTSYATHAMGVFNEITSSGSQSTLDISQIGNYTRLKPGYTGDQLTTAVGGLNEALSTAKNIIKPGSSYGNGGGAFAANGLTTGNNYGATGLAENGDTSIGGLFRAGYKTSSNNKAGAVYIGAMGIARNDNSGKSVGGYFGLDTVGNIAMSSAGLVSDNAGTVYPSFIARNNGTAAFEVLSGGQLQANGYTGSAFYGTLAHRLGVTSTGLIIQDTTTTSGGGGGTTTSSTVYDSVTEQQSFYNGEFYWNHGLNTTTGAFTSTTSNDISDYIPVPGNTSITISSTDSSLITIYGWTYDTTLTAISAIRSSGLIGTTLKTYTFTTPSNARYLAVYTKAASDSFNLRLKINSTSTITYRTPVTPEQFTGSSQTSKIQQAINFARWTTSPVVLKGTYYIDSAMILSSGTRLVLNGAKVIMKYGMHDNLLRNEAVAQPASHIFPRGNRNIKIIGIGEATFQGSTEGWGGDTQGGLGAQTWRLANTRLANVENFDISGIKVKATNQWGIVIEQSRIGTIKNITGDQALEHANQAVVQIHKGSHAITIDDVKGVNRTDDFIALENSAYHDSMNILSTTVYEPYRTNLDIYDIFISNLNRSRSEVADGQLYTNAIRLLTGDGYKIHDVHIDNVNGFQDIMVQDANTSYVITTPATVNDLYNLHISNSFCPIYIYRAIKNSSFVNVPSLDVTGTFATVKPPNGSLNIYRKYQDAQPEFIESVTGGVETISISTPVLKGGTASGGNLTIQSTSNATKGVITMLPLTLDQVNSRVGINKTSPATELDIQTAAASGGININAQTTGNPLISTKIDGAFTSFIGNPRTAGTLITGTAVGDLAIASFGTNIDFSTNSGTSLMWKMNTSGHFLAGTDNTYDIGASGATRPRSGYFGTSLFSPALTGNTTSAGTLTLSSTSNATKGKIFFGGSSAYDEANIGLGLGTTAPTAGFLLHLLQTTNVSSKLLIENTNSGASSYAEFQLKSNSGLADFFKNSSTQTAYGGAGALNFGTFAAEPMAMLTNGAVRLLVSSNGNVGVGAASDASAILGVTSTTLGFLPPRMTTTQKNAIASPAEGLTVYDLTLHKLYVYDGTLWQAAW